MPDLGDRAAARSRHRARARTACAVAALLWLTPWASGHGVEPSEVLSDPALEARAREIGQELRCVVCQNQSIDDSGADLAHDLRVLVRERLTAGDSDDQVIQFIVDRYGDFVLLRPPVKPATYALWGAPLLFLLVGTAIVGIYIKQRRGAPAETPLTAEERTRVDELLKSDAGT